MGDLIQTGDAEWNPIVAAGNETEDEAQASYGPTEQPLESAGTISGSGKRKESFNLKSIKQDLGPNLVLMNSWQ